MNAVTTRIFSSSIERLMVVTAPDHDCGIGLSSTQTVINATMRILGFAISKFFFFFFVWMIRIRSPFFGMIPFSGPGFNILEEPPPRECVGYLI